jgi:hypothetical protein
MDLRRGPVRAVHVAVPEGMDDPADPSGGNSYDRRICGELTASGWDVRELVLPGPWPRPDAAALSGLRRAARERRQALESWEGTARHVAEALVAAGSRPGPVVTPRQPDEP